MLKLLLIDIDECALPGKGDCDHKCTNYEGGYYCSCLPGYRLRDDDKSCEGTEMTTIDNNQLGFRAVFTELSVVKPKPEQLLTNETP